MTGRPFPRGLSGNPGGRPSTKELSAMVRRYGPDIVLALLKVLRLPTRDHAPHIVAAARVLTQIGWPGLEKQGVLEGSMSPGQMHLLAVQMTATMVANPHLTGDPTDESPEIDGEGWISAPDLLPAPLDDIPHEALPLWDAFKARKAAERAAASAERESNPENQPEMGDFPTIQADFGGFLADSPDSPENSPANGGSVVFDGTDPNNQDQRG